MRIATWLCVAGFVVSFAGTPPSPAPCDAPPWWNGLYDGGRILTPVFFLTPMAAWWAYGLGAYGAARALMFAPVLAICLYLVALVYTHAVSGMTVLCFLMPST